MMNTESKKGFFFKVLSWPQANLSCLLMRLKGAGAASALQGAEGSPSRGVSQWGAGTRTQVYRAPAPAEPGGGPYSNFPGKE